MQKNYDATNRNNSNKKLRKTGEDPHLLKKKINNY